MTRVSMRAVPTGLRTGARQILALVSVTLILTTGEVAVRPQATGQRAGQLTLCHAGSLQAAFAQVEKTFAAQHPDVTIAAVSGGSVVLAGRLAAGLQACDVYAAADYLDIDLLLKPIGLVDYTVIFAKGRMVLAYLATDPMTRGVAAAGEFNPPTSIPHAAADWYRILMAPGARTAGSHPFLDPSGYRSHMIFQLAQTFYQTPNLANSLLEHYTILPNVGGINASRPALGTDYNFQFIYEHSAAAAAKNNPSYRYVAVPDRIDLSTTANNRYYAEAGVTIPALGSSAAARSSISIPGARVAWGLTIPRKSLHPENAIAFVSLLLGSVGTTALNSYGPTPMTPALVSQGDWMRLPKALQSLVTARDERP